MKTNIEPMKLKARSYKRKMGEEELKLHLQAKRGTGFHKNKKRDEQLKRKKVTLSH